MKEPDLCFLREYECVGSINLFPFAGRIRTHVFFLGKCSFLILNGLVVITTNIDVIIILTEINNGKYLNVNKRQMLNRYMYQ